MAQAFHWFDYEKFKLECKRILKSNSQIILVWNNRKEKASVTLEIFQTFKTFCPDFKGFTRGFDEKNIEIFFNGNFETKCFLNNLYFEKDKFINRCLSGSYSLAESDKDYNRYMIALESLFEKYSKENVLEMPNETKVYIGKVSSLY